MVMVEEAFITRDITRDITIKGTAIIVGTVIKGITINLDIKILVITKGIEQDIINQQMDMDLFLDLVVRMLIMGLIATSSGYINCNSKALEITDSDPFEVEMVATLEVEVTRVIFLGMILIIYQAMELIPFNLLIANNK